MLGLEMSELKISEKLIEKFFLWWHLHCGYPFFMTAKQPPAAYSDYRQMAIIEHFQTMFLY